MCLEFGFGNGTGRGGSRNVKVVVWGGLVWIELIMKYIQIQNEVWSGGYSRKNEKV